MAPSYKIALARLPAHLHGGIERWIEHGQLPGDFLRCVLKNDLTWAVLKTDDESYPALRDIVRFLHNDAPAECFGSPELVQAWAQGGGMQGRRGAEREAA